MQILYSRPPSHNHGCDFILVRSSPFQKAGRERGCIHTGVWKKSSEPVHNKSKIRVVWKSEPEIGPVRKRSVPFPYEQKRQVQFRSTFRACSFLRVHASAFHLLTWLLSPSILEKLSFPVGVFSLETRL